MKKAIKKSILAVLVATLTFLCVVLGGILFKTSVDDKGAFAKEVMSDVALSADTTNLVAGSQITITAVLTTKRTGTTWSSFDLSLGPISADGKSFDLNAAKCLSVATEYNEDEDMDVPLISYAWSNGKWPSSYNTGASSDKLQTQGHVRISVYYEKNTVKQTTDYPTVTITLNVGAGCPSNMTFGLKNNTPEDGFSFGTGGLDATDSPSGSTSTGLISYNNLTFGSRPASTDATLTSLEVGHATPSQTYTGATLTDSMTYTSNSAVINNFKVKPTATDAGATIKVGVGATANIDVASGAETTLTLDNTGQTTITVLVTAEDKTTTKTYTLTVTSSYVRLNTVTVTTTRPSGAPSGVTKNGLQGTFDKENETHNIYVPSDATNVVITPTILGGYGINSSVKVVATGCTASPASTVASGSALTLTGIANTGANVKLTATAKDGTTTKTYTFTLTKVDTNTAITSFTMTGKGQTTKYNSDSAKATTNGVDYYFLLPEDCTYQGTFDIGYPANATVKVAKVGSALVAYNPATYYGAGSYNVEVTAEAGNKQSYVVTVAADQKPAAFKTLEISVGNASDWVNVFAAAEYDASTTTYTIKYAPATYAPGTKIYLRGTTSGTSTTVTKSTNLTLSGTEYNGTLNIGTNTFWLKTSNSIGNATYNFVINLVEEKNTITDVAITNAPSDYTFNQATKSYNFEVGNSVSSVSFTVTTDGEYAYVYQGSGTSDRFTRSTTDAHTHTKTINLTAGSAKTVKIHAKADNGLGTDGDEYTFTITRRAADTNNYLSSLSMTEGGNPVPFLDASGNPLAFDKNTTTYYVHVKKNGRSSASFDIAATPEVTTSTVAGTGTVTFSLTGTTENSQTYNITCTSESKSTRTYKIIVQRKIDKGDFLELAVSTDGTNFTTIISDGSAVLGAPDYNDGTKTYAKTYNYVSEGFTIGTTKFYVKYTATEEATVTATSLNKDSSNYSAAMNFGSNTYAIKATTTSGSTTYNFNITLKEEQNSITDVKLTNGGANIDSSFVFSTADTTYNLTVPFTTASVKIDAITDGAYAYVYQGSGTTNKLTRTQATKTHTTTVNLTAGSTTTITIHAVSDNGTGTAGTEYTFNIRREEADGDNFLDTLYVNIDGVLTPFKEGAFDAGRNAYTIDIEYKGNPSAEVKIFATASSANAVISGDGSPTGTTHTFTFQSNKEHSTAYNIIIKPQVGSQNTYTVTIRRVISPGAFTDLEFSTDDSTYESLLNPIDQFDLTTRTYTRTFTLADLSVGDKIYLKGTLPLDSAVDSTKTKGLTLSGGKYFGTLKFGRNEFSLTAKSATGSTPYNIVINLIEDNNEIDNITLTSNGTALTGFTYDKATKSYNLTVPFATDKVHLEVLTHGDYTYVLTEVDGKLTKSGKTHSVDRSLSVGANAIKIHAVADEGTGKVGDEYVINISRTPADTNTLLDTLTLTIDGTLYDLQFNPNTNKYQVVLKKADKDKAALHIEATTSAVGATITGTGDFDFPFEDAEHSVAYPVTITSESGSTNTYTITVMQQIVSGDFEKLEFASSAGNYFDVFTSADYDAAKRTYTCKLNIANTGGIGSWIYLRAKATTGATVTQTGLVDEATDANWPYNYHGVLAFGKNTFTLSASSATGNKNYTFIVELVEDKNAINFIDITHNSAPVKISSGSYSFDPATHEYAFSVPNSVNSVTFTVGVDGEYTIVESMRGGKFTYDSATRTHTFTRALAEGAENEVKIRAKADNGEGAEGEWYVYKITRENPNDDAYLKSFDVTIGGKKVSFNEPFDPERLNYTIQVEKSEDSSYNIDIAAVANAATSTVTGTGNFKFTLIGEDAGTQTYSVTVTAEAGNTKTYTVTISQKPIVLESNYDLSRIVITGSDGKIYYDGVPSSYNNPVDITVPYLVDKVTVVVNPSSSKTSAVGDGEYTVEENLTREISVYGVAEDNSNNDGANAYKFNVSREPKSTKLGLDQLLCGGVLVKDFDPAIYHYTVRFPNTTPNTVLRAIAQDDRADVSISFDGSTQDKATKEVASVIYFEGEGSVTKLVTINVEVDGEKKTYTVELVRSGQKPRLTYLTVQGYEIYDNATGKKIDGTASEEVKKCQDFRVNVALSDNSTVLTAKADSETAQIKIYDDSGNELGGSVSTINFNSLIGSGNEFKIRIAVIPDDGSEATYYYVYFKTLDGSTKATIKIKGWSDKDIVDEFDTDNDTTAYLSKKVDFKTEKLDMSVILDVPEGSVPGTYKITRKAATGGVDAVLVDSTSTTEPHTVELEYGVNVFCVEITSPDGNNKKTFVFIAERGGVGLDYLKAQEIDALEDEYEFNKNEYFYRVPSGVSDLHLEVGIDELLRYEIKGDTGLKEGLNQVKIYIYEKDNTRASDGNGALRTITLDIYKEASSIWDILFWILLALVLIELLIIILMPKHKKEVVEKVVEVPAPAPAPAPVPAPAPAIHTVQPIIFQQSAPQPAPQPQPPQPIYIQQQPAQPQPVYVQQQPVQPVQQVQPVQPVYVQQPAQPVQPVQPAQPEQQQNRPVNIEVKIVGPDGKTVNYNPNNNKK